MNWAGWPTSPPDYAKLIAIGTEGIAAEAEKYQKDIARGSETWCFYEGVKIILAGLARFGERYAGYGPGNGRG